MPEVSSPTSSSTPVTRRDFLTLAWKGLLGLSGLLGLGGLWRYLAYQPDPAPITRFDLGPVEAFPVGTRASIPEAQAFLVHTSAGFQALSLVCPHLGCIVDPTPEGFACPCHGSRFAPEGELKHGPAARPLRSLKLETSPQGHLILDTSEEISI